MFKKIAVQELVSVCPSDLKSLSSSVSSPCYSGIEGLPQTVFIQNDHTLYRVDDFKLIRNREYGIDLGGGSQLLLKGWAKVLKVSGYYPLLLQSGSFGFPHHLGSYGLEEYKDYYSRETIVERNTAGYIIDQEKLICYEVEEISFTGEDPKKFDYFGTKLMVLFDGKKEVGYIDEKRTCYLPNPKSKSKIHPMVNCWFQNN